VTEVEDPVEEENAVMNEMNGHWGKRKEETASVEVVQKMQMEKNDTKRRWRRVIKRKRRNRQETM
jgi:hypothetical protein